MASWILKRIQSNWEDGMVGIIYLNWKPVYCKFAVCLTYHMLSNPEYRTPLAKATTIFSAVGPGPAWAILRMGGIDSKN